MSGGTRRIVQVYVAAKTVNGIGGGNAQSFFKLREIIIFIGNNFGNFLTLCVATTVGGGTQRTAGVNIIGGVGLQSTFAVAYLSILGILVVTEVFKK